MAVGMHGNGVFKVHVDFTGIHIKLNEDGTLVFFTGSHDMGNGSVTLQKMILSRELKIPVDQYGSPGDRYGQLSLESGRLCQPRSLCLRRSGPEIGSAYEGTSPAGGGGFIWESRGWTCEPGSLELGDRCLYHLDSGRQVTLKELLQLSIRFASSLRRLAVLMPMARIGPLTARISQRWKFAGKRGS